MVIAQEMFPVLISEQAFDYSLHTIQFPLVFFNICVSETRTTGALCTHAL
jgi:hypothetical protein